MNGTPLQWTTLPLDQHALIEASAGTGKTYTITFIYLRMLLERGLSVRQILVCTFTEAATQELRDRVRTRLEEAEGGLRELCDGTAKAGELTDWLRTLLDRSGDGGALMRMRLRLAHLELDQASIFTLHGFCQRVLVDLPLEGQALLARGELIDESELLAECVTDYFLREFARARSSWPAEVQGIDIRGLQRQVAPALQQRDAQCLAVGDDVEMEYLALWNRVREDSNIVVLQQVLRGEPCDFGLRTDFSAALAAAIEALQRGDWRESIGIELGSTKSGDAQHKRLLAQGRTSSIHEIPAIRVLRDLADLRPALLRESRGRLLAAAIEYAKIEIPRRANLQHGYTYSDLIDNLDRALHGKQAGTLALRMHQRWPVALIDEFQDIDPRQFRILDRVYRERGSLLMIGDPKQAIYAFRGGDVHAYLRVAQDPRIARYSLATNWRSSTALVAAINHFYAAAGPAALLTPGITYQSVVARGKVDAQGLARNGVPLVQPLCLHRVAVQGTSMASTDEACMSACADVIVGLLNDTSLRIGEKPLSPDSCAVLLQRNSDLQAMRRLLRARGVPCVGAGRSNVMASVAALEIERLLTALLDCRDETRLRGVLSGRLFGLDQTALRELGDNPAQWQKHVDRFVHLSHVLRHAGSMGVLDRVFADASARLLAAEDGERLLTDLRHVAELLQEQSTRTPGASELVTWLRRERAQAEAGMDAGEHRQLRIETDAKRVQLMTVHASKGLEFDVVLLPQLWRASMRTGRFAPDSLLLHGAEGQALIDTGSTDFDTNLRQWHAEQLAERLRLQYVALTRARHACHVFYAESGLSQSASAAGVSALADLGALGWHARCVDAASSTGGESAFSTLSNDAAAIALVSHSSDTNARFQSARQASASAGEARHDFPLKRDDWSIHSFSSLARTAETELPALFHDGPDDDATSVEPGLTEADLVLPVSPADPALLALADWRGPKFGNLLHSLFEQSDPALPMLPQQRELMRRMLRRHGFVAGDDGRLPRELATMIDRVRRVDLGAGLFLNAVSHRDVVAELEFLLPLHKVHPAEVNALCQAHGYANTVPTQATSLDGLLKGFVDLSLRHKARYYLLDYKSNWLGDRIEDYSAPRLVQAMQAAHYDLQLLLYTVALHRHLTQRLRDYDYERDFGGAIYLFVRGIGLAPGCGIHHERPPRALIEALDQAFAGGTSRRPAR